MNTVINGVDAVVDGSITWIGQFVTVITSNPILLIGIIISFVGLGVGLIRRLMKL